MQSLLKLKPYLRPYYGLILGSILLAFPLAALRLAPAPLIRYMLDHLIIGKDTRQLFLLPILLVGLYCLNFVVRFAHYYLLRIVIIRVNQKIKNKIFGHLLGLSADYFTAQSTGNLITRTNNDPQYIDSGLSCINVIIREPITLLFLMGYTFMLNWRLTLITLLIFPPLAWIFSASGRNIKRYILKITEINGQVVSTLQESFTGIRIVKSFGLEKYVFKKYREKMELFSNLLLKTSLIEEVSHPMVELLTAIALAPIVYYGGAQIIHGRMTAGDLFAFFAAFAMMMNPIRLLNEVNLKLHQASAAFDRIQELLAWKPNLHEPVQPLPLRSFSQGIELSHVSFAYPDSPDRLVLRNIHFSIPIGKVVAVVGASGAGKSSLVSLLPRIFDVTSGSILLDGQDIRNFSLSSLRKMIAIVSQDVFLFNDTLYENIRCGRLSATRDDIYEAARKAYALDFIEKFPNGFSTTIGDRGQKLSGGERQRISIARAFLRKTPILILDEATSSLDATSEKAIQRALDELMQNRTTLIIAHRLSTIRNASQIIVLKEGEIIERGDHASLLSMRGEYARFHDTLQT